jgi:hypothetical protein
MNPNEPPGYPPPHERPAYAPPYQQPGYPAPDYGPPQPVYPAQPGYAAPAAPPQVRPGSRRALGFGLVGFAVAAIIAVILCATGVMPVRGSGSSVDSSALSLPTKLGKFVRYQDAKLSQGAKVKSTVAYRKRADRKTAQALSRAYDGAGTAVQTYTNQDLLTTFSVWAVRASSPGLVETYVDPKFVGLAAAPEAVKRFGAVECVIVQTISVPAGQKPKGGMAILCQRSRKGLTVSLHIGDGDLAQQPQRVVALVNQVWKSLG